MNFLKRATMAVVRKVGRSFIFIVIFFVIANLVLTGFSIQHATEVASDNARKKLGGTISVSFDRQKAFNEVLKGTDNDNSKIEIKPVTESMFNKISGLSGILNANMVSTGYGLAKGFDPVRPQGIDENSAEAVLEKARKEAEKSNKNSKEYKEKMEQALKEYEENLKKQMEKQQNEYDKRTTPKGGAPGFEGGIRRFEFKIPGLPNMPQGPGSIRIGDASSMPDVTITGVLSSNTYQIFASGEAKLLEGEAIVAENQGEKQAVIDTNLAKLNKLKIGDAIKVKAVSGDKTVSLKIIGIYENANAQDTGNGMAIRSATFMQPYNNIFTDVDTANLLKNTDGEKATGMDSAVFTVKDPREIDSIVNEAKKLDIDWDKYSIDANQAAYKQMVGPIENVASFAMIVLYLVAIAGALILCLLMMLSVKDRMFETGVLMSMGEGKLKIIAQYVLEVVMIAVVAFALSYFSGQMIAQKTGDYLMNREVEAVQQQQEEIQGGNGGFMIGRGFNRQIDSVGQIDKIEVQITPEEMGKTFGLGFLIIILGTLLPAITIMRFKPKTILTKA